ncbi:hypothetical protein CSIM01_02864 [Colletotrichum simmondsii]|uniref:Uncharacterized protein n=1 Tax=Colletotrichum simmondsii TaxID=703756 RepID=A0A135RS72_9PEZI|nr:hypothetical protein CSIM01_02864 [Colletotrichum simmondsii]
MPKTQNKLLILIPLTLSGTLSFANQAIIGKDRLQNGQYDRLACYGENVLGVSRTPFCFELGSLAPMRSHTLIPCIGSWLMKDAGYADDGKLRRHTFELY